jgi:hypothetical protein
MGLAFIPFRLEINQAPQYAHFPLNVMFGATKTVEGKPTLWTTLYEPDFSTYKKSDDDGVARMLYHNRFNRDWSLVIIWTNVDGKESYTALKYLSGSEEPVFETHGAGDWDKFFSQLTIIGLMPGETCEISPMTEAPKRP